jgi:hypothetical protein
VFSFFETSCSFSRRPVHHPPVRWEMSSQTGSPKWRYTRLTENARSPLHAEPAQLRDERVKKFPSGVFLFFEASGRYTPITPKVERDCGSFVLALDGLPKREIRNRHGPLVRKILAAIGLGLASVAGFEKISDATVFFTDQGKTVYGFNFEGGIGELLVSRRPSAEDLAATRQLAEKIAKDNVLERVIRLLNESLKPDQEKLRKFLSAWMALEVYGKL